LGRWICQVHIKDARHTNVPGTWGEEMPAGSGEVDWTGFFAALRDIGYRGAFVIEREAGSERIADIRRAKEVVEKTFC
jgi:L-ribulose-5-phosphate 3-epimerase